MVPPGVFSQVFILGMLKSFVLMQSCKCSFQGCLAAALFAKEGPPAPPAKLSAALGSEIDNAA